MLRSAPSFCGTGGECLNDMQQHHYEETCDADDCKHRKLGKNGSRWDHSLDWRVGSDSSSINSAEKVYLSAR